MAAAGAQKPLDKAAVIQHCRKYVRQGPALAHAFSDLSYAQRWQDLRLIELPEQMCCVLAGRAKAGAEERFVLPLNLDEHTSIRKLSGVIRAIEPSPPALTIGIVAPDSSIVYYNVKPGIVAPKEAPDEV